MKFDQPATKNVIDQLKVVGQPVDRIDGRSRPPEPRRMRTTGTSWSRTRRTVTSCLGDRQGPHRLDGPRRGEAAPGVIAIVTAQNAGKLGKGNFNTALLLGGPNIQHYHQAIALVVAETYEQARAAAHLVRVQYTCRRRARMSLAAMKDSAKPADSFGAAAESKVGDFAGAFAAAPVKLDASYTTAHESHDDGAARDHRRVGWRPAHALDRKPDDRVERGGPGEDARHPEGEGAAHVALHRRLRRKALDSRRRGPGRARCACSATAGGRAGARHHAQQYRHRSATLQRIRIGATKDGKITAIAHESWSGDLAGGKPKPRPCKPGRCTRGPTA